MCHYDDFESLRTQLEDAGVEEAWERDITEDLNQLKEEILKSLGD